MHLYLAFPCWELRALRLRRKCVDVDVAGKSGMAASLPERGVGFVNFDVGDDHAADGGSVPALKYDEPLDELTASGSTSLALTFPALR